MATNLAKAGALRALSLTMTALLLSLSVLAPAASALGGLPVDPARVVRDAVAAINDIAKPPCGPYATNTPEYAQCVCLDAWAATNPPPFSPPPSWCYVL